jgi:ketosteroid isomerase-like protein
MTDPATAEWREAMGASTSAQLRQTQQALAASQADLTRAEREVEGVREELTRQAETAVGAWTDRQVGRTYKTRCAHVMTGQEGAVLTTRKANCGPCLRGGR